jgi:hypothetical protein
MRTDGSRSFTAGNQGGKSPYRKTLSVLLIVTVMLASFPVFSVFAALPHDPPLPGDPQLEQVWADELSQLAKELTFFNSFRPIVALSVNPANQRRQLDMYRAAISDAESLVTNQTGFDEKGHVTNPKHANEAVQELADYLDKIRGLKEKLGAGRTLVSTAFPTSTDNTLQIIGIEQEWESKRGLLAIEIALFIRFRTMPGRSGYDVNQGKYLDKYRSAIIVAQTIEANHDGFDATGKVIDVDRASQTVKQLADALHMIRGLREKLGGGGQM